jgi:hypothetical protein
MQGAEPLVDVVKFDHGRCRLAERLDCKTLVGILYQQRLFARIISVFADLRKDAYQHQSGKTPTTLGQSRSEDFGNHGLLLDAPWGSCLRAG